ncbi:MAG: hypothetical protein HKN70_05870 [Gammaproteobacteria bacterium]|nr:hypothetical protein [Gammaproteobacteria bacterium]
MIALLLMGPLASAAYLLVVVLPEFFASYSGQKTTKKLQRLINPKGDVKRLSDDMSRSNSVETRRRLAEELLEHEDFDEAEKLFRESRVGMFEHDPVMMLGQARALFGLERYTDVIRVLDELTDVNPGFQNQDGHLLYARAHGELGLHDKAIAEFEAVTEYFAGPEANVFYAQYLEAHGEAEKAGNIYKDIVKVAELSPAHYRRTHRIWIKMAQQKI